MNETMKAVSRRNVIKVAFGGLIAGATGLVLSKRAEAQQIHGVWVHGHSVMFGRSKTGGGGDTLDLGGSACVALMRLEWAARFTVYDCGDDDLAKPAEFWCHFAIPTPVTIGRQRARARTLRINYEANNNRVFGIRKVHVWDGNMRIAADAQALTGNTVHNGGIHDHMNYGSPDTSKLYRWPLRDREVFFGIGVSIFMKTTGRSKGDTVEIRGVGVDFVV